jgi:hypothetical protein
VRSSKVQGLITSVTVKGGRSLKKESRIPRVYHTPRGVCQPPVPYASARTEKKESAMARSRLRSRARATPINVESVAGLVAYCLLSEPGARARVIKSRAQTRLLPGARGGGGGAASQARSRERSHAQARDSRRARGAARLALGAALCFFG